MGVSVDLVTRLFESVVRPTRANQADANVWCTCFLTIAFVKSALCQVANHVIGAISLVFDHISATLHVCVFGMSPKQIVKKRRP